MTITLAQLVTTVGLGMMVPTFVFVVGILVDLKAVRHSKEK